MPAPKNTNNEKKIDIDLIPFDLLIEFLPPAYEEGLIKYYRESWRLGFKTTDMFKAAMRHLIAYRYGDDYDPDAEHLGIKKHHLAGALFSILCMLDTFKNHHELDDRFDDHRPCNWNEDVMKKQIEDYKENLKNKRTRELELKKKYYSNDSSFGEIHLRPK